MQPLDSASLSETMSRASDLTRVLAATVVLKTLKKTRNVNKEVFQRP